MKVTRWIAAIVLIVAAILLVPGQTQHKDAANIDRRLHDLERDFADHMKQIGPIPTAVHIERVERNTEELRELRRNQNALFIWIFIQTFGALVFFILRFINGHKKGNGESQASEDNVLRRIK